MPLIGSVSPYYVPGMNSCDGLGRLCGSLLANPSIYSMITGELYNGFYNAIASLAQVNFAWVNNSYSMLIRSCQCHFCDANFALLAYHMNRNKDPKGKKCLKINTITAGVVPLESNIRSYYVVGLNTCDGLGRLAARLLGNPVAFSTLPVTTYDAFLRALNTLSRLLDLCTLAMDPTPEQVTVLPTVDVGNLLVEDLMPIDQDEFDADPEKYLLHRFRNSVQKLVDKLWQPRLPTKWEQFAKLKGIKKRKKPRLVWDEVAKEWKPRYGFRRVKDPKDDWLIPIPDQKDPYDDYLGKKVEAKKETIAKNELQRLRNIKRRSITAGN
ncbi:unnamed protein product [Soboliphyme baturini]|uniref:Ribosome biogenesis regulatory protein n=1 Tax=Soboliphyme baturini TaxID=241478 RepID=A0A183IGY7_9BILA|nr:unnamed protein product [Soboliphyme baturini]